MGDKELKKLLTFGLKHYEKERAEEQKEKISALDPKWVDVILGKTDGVRMKECLDIICDESTEWEKKIGAFDELELLIESIDNSVDFVKAGFSAKIVAQLKSTDERLRMHSLWILGTLVQNNQFVLEVFMQENVIEEILSFLKKEESLMVLGKSIYFFSSSVGMEARLPQSLVTDILEFISLKFFLKETSFQILDKCLFLACNIVRSYPDIKVKVTSNWIETSCHSNNTFIVGRFIYLIFSLDHRDLDLTEAIDFWKKVDYRNEMENIGLYKSLDGF